MRKKLEVSFISSFDAGHFDEPSTPWPHQLDCTFVELYAFMHNSLTSLFPGADGESALQELSRAYDRPEEAKRIAGVIHEHFKPRKVSAVASHLPEILASEESDLWEQAQRSLCFLISVISELRELGHPSSTLVMAAGSCFDGIWLGRDRLFGGETPVVNRLSRPAALKKLVERLRIVARHAHSNRVTLAVSMEPGPLYALGDWESLKLFCQMVDDEKEEISSTVGLNLDIAHWCFLSNISADMVRGNPSVMNRVVHAHLSDHDRGHCADAFPGTFHPDVAFLPWLSLLKERSETPQHRDVKYPPYSGFVSCEHELACRLSTIRLSVGLVRHLMAQC